MAHDPVVFVVDDDAAVRDGLGFLFASVGLAVEAYDSADAFLQSLPSIQSGCILTDVRMPGLSGLELQARLLERRLTLPVIVMTGHGDVRMAVRAMKAGAFDFIEKPFNDQEVLDLIRHAIDHDLSSAGSRQRREEVQQRLKSLTPRETQVLELVMTGEPNKRIAYQLGISEKTVEFHRANVMSKVGARSSADLIRTVATLPVAKGYP